MTPRTFAAVLRSIRLLLFDARERRVWALAAGSDRRSRRKRRRWARWPVLTVPSGPLPDISNGWSKWCVGPILRGPVTTTVDADPLARFSAPVREWFRASFAAPTEAQADGWAAISEGRHTLIHA